MNQSIHEYGRAKEQAKLDAAELSAVEIKFEHYRIGDKVRFGARLYGPPELQKKALKFLSFSESINSEPC